MLAAVDLFVVATSLYLEIILDSLQGTSRLYAEVRCVCVCMRARVSDCLSSLSPSLPLFPSPSLPHPLSLPLFSSLIVSPALSSLVLPPLSPSSDSSSVCLTHTFFFSFRGVAPHSGRQCIRYAFNVIWPIAPSLSHRYHPCVPPSVSCGDSFALSTAASKLLCVSLLPTVPRPLALALQQPCEMLPCCILE